MPKTRFNLKKTICLIKKNKNKRKKHFLQLYSKPSSTIANILYQSTVRHGLRVTLYNCNMANLVMLSSFTFTRAG